MPVTIVNLIRAETDMYLTQFANRGGFGKFNHSRDLPLGEDTDVRPNCDTLYSLWVFDLDASPVTIKLSDAVRALHDDDGVRPGSLRAHGHLRQGHAHSRPANDRHALCIRSVSDSGRLVGRPQRGVSIQRRMQSTSTSRMLTTTARPYRLTVKDVPVDGFWFVIVSDERGLMLNSLDAYSLNNVMAKRGSDASVAIQFGGCDGKIPNCLPIVESWNYVVRPYRPRKNILDGTCKFPQAQLVK